MVKEFHFINLFRALAAFWVLAAHCMIWGGWYEVPVPHPKLAVDLFMMISGFLMASNASARKDFEPLAAPRNWTRFWMRRYFRIAPAYYFALLLAVVLKPYRSKGILALQQLNPDKWQPGGTYDPSRIEYTLHNILMHVSFLFGLHPELSHSSGLPDWSLSLEMQFYLIFPILILVIQKWGRLTTLLPIAFAASVVGFLIRKHVHYLEPSLLLFHLNKFIAGMLLFQALDKESPRRTRLTAVFAAMIALSFDLAYSRNYIFTSGSLVPNLTPFVTQILLLAMILLGWLEINNRTPKWLSAVVLSKPIRFASDSSYAVYLFHGFFISCFGLFLASAPSMTATITPFHRTFCMLLFVSASTYSVGHLIYRTIELPGIRFGKCVIRQIATKKADQRRLAGHQGAKP